MVRAERGRSGCGGQAIRVPASLAVSLLLWVAGGALL